MFEDNVRARIEAFTREVEALVRQSTLEAISSALGGKKAPQARPAAARPAAAPTAAPRAVAAPAKVSFKRKPGGKRTAEQLAAIDAAIVSFVKSTPGQGVEAMGKSLGVPTNDLKLRVLGLVTRKKIAKKGQKRATKYFPA